MNKSTLGRWSSAALILAAVTAQAQQVPDAGTLLRQQPAPPSAAPAPAPLLTPEVMPDKKAMEGPRFTVREIRFAGAVLIPEAELQAQVRTYLNTPMTMGILQLVAQQLTGYYLQKGYLARVVVPEQDVNDGVVELRIIEGTRGSLELNNRGQRVQSDRVAEFINQRLPQGAPLSISRLDEAVAILNEQPGVQAGSSLKPGTRESEVGVVVSVTDKPLWSTAVGINDHGGRGSGRIQTQGSVSLNNPTGRFDAASLLLNATQGTTFLRGDYSLAVGSRGLRLGVNASRLDYDIIEDSLRALDLNGTAGTYGVTASYPLVRTRDLNLSLTGSHDVKELIDRSGAADTSNREVSVTSVGIAGDRRHRIGRRGVTTSFGAAFSFGDSDQRNAGALAVDSLSRQANGNFSKLAYTLANLGEISTQWSYNVALRGQFAGNNLDSSERMSLGGPGAVRAYPVGEATGDEGWLINFNLRRSFGNTLATTLFYDAGGITLNRNTWANWNAGNPRLPNRYMLSGLGASVDWRVTRAALISAIFAVPAGSNPGRDVNNRNADGSDNSMRVWLSLNAQF